MALMLCPECEKPVSAGEEVRCPGCGHNVGSYVARIRFLRRTPVLLLVVGVLVVAISLALDGKIPSVDQAKAVTNPLERCFSAGISGVWASIRHLAYALGVGSMIAGCLWMAIYAMVGWPSPRKYR